MKKSITAILGLSLCATAPLFAQDQSTPAPEPAATEAPAPEQATAPAPSPEVVTKVISYYLGYNTGQQLGSFDDGPLHIDDIDGAVFMKALEDGLKGKVDPEITKMDLHACMNAFVEKLAARNKELSAQNLAKSDAFFAENGKKEGVETTQSGLQYKVLTPAEGEKYDEAKHGKNVQMYITYEGRLLDGTVFDKAETPTPFPIVGVIPGVAEALQMIPVGSEWEIYIPSKLAYGEHGPGPLGANAALIFKIKLHEIKPMGTTDNPIELTPEMLQQMKDAGMVPVEQ